MTDASSQPKDEMPTDLWDEDEKGNKYFLGWKGGNAVWELLDTDAADPELVRKQVDVLLNYEGVIYGGHCRSFKQWFTTVDGIHAMSNAENKRLFDEFMKKRGDDDEL